jgi:hypothetical protein
VGVEAGEVEGDEPDADGDSLGAREVDRGCFGGGPAVGPGNLASGAASLLRRARVAVRSRRQAEERDEGDENDGRPDRAEHGVERSG